MNAWGREDRSEKRNKILYLGVTLGSRAKWGKEKKQVTQRQKTALNSVTMRSARAPNIRANLCIVDRIKYDDSGGSLGVRRGMKDCWQHETNGTCVGERVIKSWLILWEAGKSDPIRDTLRNQLEVRKTNCLREIKKELKKVVMRNTLDKSQEK
jgi:hypothetical protein